MGISKNPVLISKRFLAEFVPVPDYNYRGWSKISDVSLFKEGEYVDVSG